MTTLPGDADGHHIATFWSRFGQRDGRGLYRSVTFLTLFSLLFGGLLLMQPTSAGAQSTATTTDSLNLRTGPGTDTSIITVMPSGATVSVNGGAEAGFYPVSYNGYSGYASGDYLSIGGGSSSGGVATDGATGTAYVIDGRLNLRSGTSLNHGVILVLPDGAEVSLTGEYGNGFLGVVYKGTSGFAHGDYLSTSGSAPAPEPEAPPVSGNVTGTATVNVSALNIRSGPSTNNGVLGVMQQGASVSLTGESSNGFVSITYNGIQGWTFAEYLTTGGSPAPAPDPAPNPGSGSVSVGDTVVNSGHVSTDALNFRTGPSTSYGVITVMYSGAGVEIMGDPQAGFYPIRYNGTKGWASSDYITVGTAKPTTPATGQPGNPNDDMIQIIYAAADRYGQPRADMLRVARCESVLDPKAINRTSNASGLFQFLPGTWATTPYADEDIFDPVANANAAGWMWSVGRRNEWTCQ